MLLQEDGRQPASEFVALSVGVEPGAGRWPARTYLWVFRVGL